MRRSPKKRINNILDILHKGFVWTCIGVTVVGSGILGYRFYKYVTVTKPQLAERKRIAHQDLLAEGSSENLQDTAPTIS